MSQTANWLVPPPGANTVGTASAAEGTIFPSAVYSVGTLNSIEIANPTAKGVRLFVNVTNFNGGTVTVSIQSKDPVSGNWVNVPDGATTGSIASGTTNCLTVYPGLAESTTLPSVEVSDHLDISWRVVMVVATASVTLSVGGTYLS